MMMKLAPAVPAHGQNASIAGRCHCVAPSGIHGNPESTHVSTHSSKTQNPASPSRLSKREKNPRSFPHAGKIILNATSQKNGNAEYANGSNKTASQPSGGQRLRNQISVSAPPSHAHTAEPMSQRFRLGRVAAQSAIGTAQTHASEATSAPGIDSA